MVRRRWLPTLLAALAVALLAAACDPAEDPAAVPEVDDTPVDDPVAPDEEPDAPDAYSEAPVLAELVEAGELPGVDERLPDNPLVVQPWEEIGQYGGDWNTALLGPGDAGGWFARTVTDDKLMVWDLEFTEVSPNLAEEVEFSEDSTEFTFHLREGIRWSDGEAFTAHDILFWYDDYIRHEGIATSVPAWLRTGEDDVPAEMEAVDDHTLVIRFDGGPHGLFLQLLASPDGAGMVAFPRHYLEQFHADYNPDIDALVEEEGLADWQELIEFHAGTDQGNFRPGLPTIRAWHMSQDFGVGTTVNLERNPYYWKVDPDGNQLPYLDRVVFHVVEDAEVLMFRAMEGGLDMHGRHIIDLANFPVLSDHQDQGNYRLPRYANTWNNELNIYLNQAHKDPALREVFQNRDFRIGLSHAINRQDIIDVVYVGQGEPFQAAPRPESEFFNEQLAYQYTEYDPDLANEHLDAAGYSERDGAGYRLGPDGERISFAVDIHAGVEPAQVDVMEMVQRDWDAVGIDMQLNVIDRSLAGVRADDNDADANVWSGGGGGGLDVIHRPREYVPIRTDGPVWAVPWANHYLGLDPDTAPVEEPIESVAERQRLYRQLESTADPDEQFTYMEEILEIAAEEFDVLGIMLPPEGFYIQRNDFHNVPEMLPYSFTFPWPATGRPETWYTTRE